MKRIYTSPLIKVLEDDPVEEDKILCTSGGDSWDPHHGGDRPGPPPDPWRPWDRPKLESGGLE